MRQLNFAAEPHRPRPSFLRRQDDGGVRELMRAERVTGSATGIRDEHPAGVASRDGRPAAGAGRLVNVSA